MLRQRQSWWCTRHHASKQGLAVSDHYESTTAALHVYVSCASNVWALFRCSSFTRNSYDRIALIAQLLRGG
ncbi:hypothetical protein IG631_18412 [Alternaria alternata]|nr:hypothetical protein IG631_18412 [Alternaria alternata]